MATRDEVLDAIGRIERAGGAGHATRAAQAALTLPLPASGYDHVLNRLRSAQPSAFGPAEPPRIQPASGEEQLGSSARAMKTAEAALAHQLSTTAEFDRQIIEALRHVHKTTQEGRRRLDNLEAEVAGAAQVWDLGTATGAREFQRFLIAKLGEIIQVVEDTNDDDASKQALATALTALYAAQSGRTDSPPGEPTPEPADDPVPPPAVGPADAVPGDLDDDGYYEPLLEDEPATGYQNPPQRLSEVPAMPGIGGEGPGFGAMPAGMPGGFPPAGMFSGLDRGDPPVDDEYPFEDAAPADDITDDADGGADGDEAAPDSPHEDGPTTVTLPDGATTAVSDPRLAAAMQAAADGTPVAEAFHRQGIDIPPAGTPVATPLDQTRLQPGDIGVFTDRHALAVGNGKALLDGQIHLVGNLRGPGFLGWQHPPVRIEGPDAATEPVPTRPAMVLRA